MKKITFMLMCMLAILTGFSACSSDNNDGDKQMTNYVSISAAGNTIINEDDDEEEESEIVEDGLDEVEKEMEEENE